MDDRGNWHNTGAQEAIADAFRNDGRLPENQRRFVMELAHGESVTVRKADGTCLTAAFVGAEKNKVTLRPEEDQTPRPYLEFAERVTLEKAGGPAVAAQVWDNRGGKLILRTLGVGQ